ncbi:universal stress protein [Brachybacterium saurashtrense]|uniref:universal stress protein n=1 Tax=Brachybacterium saurashtrense TaxID=556288 RepID=UPI001F496B3D|nr:universal stress protein [Brachybacterium saurashtrense]
MPASPAARPLGVLVGFDGSDQSRRALLYAARAARRLGSALTVVTAYTVPTLAYADAALVPTVPAEVARLAAAQSVLEEARELLRGYPGEVDLRTAHGDAAGVLVGLSERAQLAVVGARGRGGFFGLLLGSVSSALPAHAHCPTVVVPRQYEIGTDQGAARFAPVDEDTPVVAGIDRSASSASTARHAAVAARTRGAPLHLLMVMPLAEDWGGASMSWLPDPDLLERHRRELADQLAQDAEALRAEHPDLTITSETVLAEPVTTLIERTAGAQLTVLGTRGHGRVASTLLGSVSQAVLQRAQGPVMVVPVPAREMGADAAQSSASG